ncbi:maleylpyruvate isomerase N-terminal domain-containing protein [Tepidiforma sp.]|uniref:maleylpyruvate isomerase N-terminal domain-containing protein n=1 Tax=Tepidiforma sp. TaxID=2682230 RepID=UPI002ADE72D8|nr:maleylpyruvate isomerase N-terminal domain-containing protein [Tepidiforma sp.]
MTDKQQMLEALDAGYRRFRESIANLDDAAFQEVWLGSWDLSRLLAHMAGWYREMAGALERVARGERPAPEGVDYSDVEAWNARFAAAALSGRAALADWDEAFRAYRAAAEALPDHLYGVDPASGRPRIGNRLLQGAGIGHFEEHQPELEAWLARRGR